MRCTPSPPPVTLYQEFFVPPSAFVEWNSDVEPVLKSKFTAINLLNCTIRFVRKDEETKLPYAPVSASARA